MFKNIKKTLAKIVLGAGIIAGAASQTSCVSPLQKLSDEQEIEIARQRDGITDEEWNYQILLYPHTEDPEGKWFPPLVTITRKEEEGIDCEEMATLSAWYSGHIYGNNVLIIQGKDKITEDTSGHAFHLLEKNGKYGARSGFQCDTSPVKYNSLKSLIAAIQERRSNVDYRIYAIIDLDKMNPNWRTTRENMLKDYLDWCMKGKGEGGLIKSLK